MRAIGTPASGIAPTTMGDNALPECQFRNSDGTCSHDDAPIPNGSECVGWDCGVRGDADCHKVEKS